MPSRNVLVLKLVFSIFYGFATLVAFFDCVDYTQLASIKSVGVSWLIRYIN